jgi:SAM-dependent methyltransferase
LLNAGCGVYSIGAQSWGEIAVDLFEEPLAGRTRAVCANIELLPFRTGAFGAIVCIGEVLGYCDPAAALSEFSRVLAQNGVLLCDFGSTTSARHWLTPSFDKATALVTDTYNDRPEVLWNYSPGYVRRLLRRNDFEIERVRGSHTVSAVARRCGMPLHRAAALERRFGGTMQSIACADLVLVAARKA